MNWWDELHWNLSKFCNLNERNEGRMKERTNERRNKQMNERRNERTNKHSPWNVSLHCRFGNIDQTSPWNLGKSWSLRCLMQFYTWFQPKAKIFLAPWSRTYQYWFQLKIFLWVMNTLKKKLPLFFNPLRSKTNYDSVTLIFQHFASAACNYVKF